jgi:predicted acyltransferase
MIRNSTSQLSAGRVVSLDVMRGIIMILLCGESCMVYVSLKNLNLASPLERLVDQFFHQPWYGLHFWDLVQPAFMFMAGAALYISYSRKLEKGSSWNKNLNHVLIRSFRLLLCGVLLHCVYAGKMVWELWNVLTQLSITTLIAYLIIGKSNSFQIIFSFGLLLLTEVLYRFINVPGFNQPFIEHHNFGAYADMLLMGKINPDGWVTINFIPTAAHTIWGVLAGKLLISERSVSNKLKILTSVGTLALILGFGLDLLNITPIIKRISTSSFALASGGWVLLMLALSYWFIDVKQNTRYAWIFIVMGMNAIFIYLFFETVGMQWVNPTIGIFTGGLMHSFFNVSVKAANVITALCTWVAEWGLCYWLYKRNIFFKL